jgi:hypothetical protein
MEDVRNANKISVGKLKGKRSLGRPRRRLKDNIKMDLTEREFGSVDWIHMAHDRGRWWALLNTVINMRVP